MDRIIKNMNELHNHEEKINDNAEKIVKNTGALDLLHTINSNSNKYFIIWIITFIIFFITETASILYIFKLKSDANTIVTTTTEEIEQDADDGEMDKAKYKQVSETLFDMFMVEHNNIGAMFKK